MAWACRWCHSSQPADFVICGSCFKDRGPAPAERVAAATGGDSDSEEDPRKSAVMRALVQGDCADRGVLERLYQIHGAEQNCEEIMRVCYDTWPEVWQDPEWPVEPDDGEQLLPEQCLSWARRSAGAASGDWTISPSAIVQGDLLDCWFLSALAVVCTRPELMRRVLVSNGPSRCGLYCLRFWHDGLRRTVFVDDRFPVTPSGELAYARPADGRPDQLWVPLVEKAYAKLHGSYDAICSGSARDALSNLTGFPCDRVDLEPPQVAEDHADVVWATLRSGADHGYIMAANCGRQLRPVLPEEAYADRGLLPRHCYTVLGLHDVGPEGARVLRLRDPWGRAVRAAADRCCAELHGSGLPAADREHGEFYLDLASFLHCFSSVDVCQTHRDWRRRDFEDAFSARHWPRAGCAQFGRQYAVTVRQPTRAFISVVQQDVRGAALEHQLKDVGFVVLGQSGGDEASQVPITVCLPRVQRLVTAEAQLSPGYTYLLLPFSLLNLVDDLPFVLSIGASTKVSFTARRQEGGSLDAFTRALHSAFLLSPPAAPQGAPAQHPVFDGARSVAVRELRGDGVKLFTVESQYSVWFFALNGSSSPFRISLAVTAEYLLRPSRRQGGPGEAVATTDVLLPGARQVLLVLSSCSPHGGGRWQMRLSAAPLSGALLDASEKVRQHDPPLPPGPLHEELFDVGLLEQHALQ
eukprot:TRINITY_DN42543_c0_g1_i1.p1 TRINITY_DN42543_c0_g1~~TRINITY_DN42543_c0_g1_i1.p1  ORF type:complete len:720 (+),score=173.03 TRINITY_DN42543_c0_g1_i1:79-2160(+)